METKTRSLLKTISWRILATLTTFLISWLVTGSAALGFAIANIEFWAKIVLYYFHERTWNKFR
jgi:uncharacterized membrane protein